MNETVSIDLGIYLLGLIVLLLIILLIMVRKLVVLLTALLERREQTIIPQTAELDRSLLNGDCTEEELAAITAVLARILPDNHRKIVSLKLIH
ncbi:MAG: acyl-CoA carboxylase subunit epsilon [Firmicutes bacterium]|nr:acyl-CoA carboxylase subunit epsilon [Bacillota bacterium]